MSKEHYMENWERGKFEEEWSQAFQNAEGPASKAAWTSIDLALTQAESGSMRKQVIWYQRLAAAAIFFALLTGVGAFLYNLSDTDNQPSLSLNQSVRPSENQNTASASSAKADKSSVTSGTQGATSSLPSSKQSLKIVDDRAALAKSNHPMFNSILNAKEDDIAYKESFDQEAIDRDLIRNRANKFVLALSMDEPVAMVKGKPREVTIWRRLPAFPASYMNSTKEKEARESLWASVGAAAGSYNPNINRSSLAMSAPVTSVSGSFTGTGYSQSSDQGTAYSFGLAMGTALSDRWVVQGGLNYLNQNLNYQSNLLSLDPSNKVQTAVADFATRNLSANTYQLTNPYEVSSVNEIVSFPLQAGYRLINRKFALQLNSGIATDLFIRNTLTDKSGNLDNYSESAGSNSPYRTISWAGLLGSEFSYKFADRYRISLVPGLRYSFNSVLKSESGTASNPLIMDVGFRFRYIFK